jgi:predicted phage terminase large subunit-like protein
VTVVAESPALVLPMLRADQYRIAVHPAKTKIVACGRRFGKSTMGGAIALACARNGGRVAWVVPIFKNGRPLWRWARSALGSQGAAGLVRINETERIIEFPNGGFLGIYSADNADSIRGEWFHLVIIDEAARIDEAVWTDVIQPTLADAGGDAIAISTPAGRNWFWKEWQRGLLDGREVASFQAPSSDNPNPRIQRAAQMARIRVPDSTYRQEWLAEFVEDGQTIYNPAWWDGRNRYDHDDRSIQNACIGRWLSWDTAMKDKDSSDYSALTVGELTPDYRLVIREVWRDKLNFPDLIGIMETKAREYDLDGKLKGIIIEDKASGTSAYQTLVASIDPRIADLVIPFMPQGSKGQRANQAAVWAKNNCILLPNPSPAVPWLLAFEEELYSFLDSDHDDQGDSLHQLVLYLENYLSVGHQAAQGRTAA